MLYLYPTCIVAWYFFASAWSFLLDPFYYPVLFLFQPVSFLSLFCLACIIFYCGLYYFACISSLKKIQACFLLLSLFLFRFWYNQVLSLLFPTFVLFPISACSFFTRLVPFPPHKGTTLTPTLCLFYLQRLFFLYFSSLIKFALSILSILSIPSDVIRHYYFPPSFICRNFILLYIYSSSIVPTFYVGFIYLVLFTPACIVLVLFT